MKKNIAIISIIAVLAAAVLFAIFFGGRISPVFNLMDKSAGKTEKKAPELYPASAMVKGKSLWGYINSKGEFVIQPKFAYAEPFEENGLAQVREDGNRYGMINGKGEYVIKPEYNYIPPFKDGFSVAYTKGEKRKILSENGDEYMLNLGENDYISGCSEGLAVLNTRDEKGKYTCRYINMKGEPAFEGAYEEASEFENGVALVKLNKLAYAVIGKDGSMISSFTYPHVDYRESDLLIYRDKNNKYGYLNMQGVVVIPAQFDQAQHFKDGFAVIGSEEGNGEEKEVKNGVIDTKGNMVIKPEFNDIFYLGEGMFSLGKVKKKDEIFPEYSYALADKTGAVLSDFSFDYIREFKEGIAEVEKNEEVYFIDKTGSKVNKVPALEAGSTLTLMGNLVRANTDGHYTYFDREGKVVWKQNNDTELENGIVIKEEKFKPSKNVYIYYPSFKGLPDKKAEDGINKKMKEAFIGGYEDTKGEGAEEGEADYNKSYSIAFCNKNMVVIASDSYFYFHHAAHGMPGRSYYHINITNGKFYELKDLFKKNSGYVQKINSIIQKQISEGSNEEYEYYNFETIQPDQLFTVDKDGITVCFSPYEIAAYAAGFPEFRIKFEEIKDIINVNGEFWKTLNQ